MSIRSFLGFGPSKSERISELESRLRWESAMLDQMAFLYPAEFQRASSPEGKVKYFRPGVAALELSLAKHDDSRLSIQDHC